MSVKLSCVRCLLRRTQLFETNKHFRGIVTIDNNETRVKKDDDHKTLVDNTTLESDDLVEPTTCCMSGCANCVWIVYAEKLSKTMANSSEEMQKLLMEKIQDPNMRAFLSFELRMRNLIR